MSNSEAWKIANAWLETWPGLKSALTYAQVCDLVDEISRRLAGR